MNASSTKIAPNSINSTVRLVRWMSCLVLLYQLKAKCSISKNRPILKNAIEVRMRKRLQQTMESGIAKLWSMLVMKRKSSLEMPSSIGTTHISISKIIESGLLRIKRTCQYQMCFLLNLTMKMYGTNSFQAIATEHKMIIIPINTILLLSIDFIDSLSNQYKHWIKFTF